MRFAGRGGRGGGAGGRGSLILIGVVAAVLIGGFFYLVSVADGLTPERQETRIELENVFND